MKVCVGMPQMAVRGLSENWLFKSCGDLHWQEISRQYHCPSHELRTESGLRVYASFVAIRARYAQPLSAINENDTLEFAVKVDQFGSAMMRSRQQVLLAEQPAISIEMLTKFVARTHDNSNDLRRASLRLRPVTAVTELDAPPPLLLDFQAVRDGKSYAIPLPEAVTLETQELNTEWRYTPNPYIDYNGAGLLYFAAYPAIADHLERLVVTNLPTPLIAGDWALHASTVARDVFYFGNLDLGCELAAQVRQVELLAGPDGQRYARVHTILAEVGTQRRLAEIYSIKAIQE